MYRLVDKKKSRWELHKNATSNFEQTQEATPNKTTAVQPLTSDPINNNNNNNNIFFKDCWLLNGILILYLPYPSATDRMWHKVSF